MWNCFAFEKPSKATRSVANIFSFYNDTNIYKISKMEKLFSSLDIGFAAKFVILAYNSSHKDD